MQLDHQLSALSKLETLAKMDKHSLLISGLSGCGKSYCASQYAKYLDASVFQRIKPKVDDLRDVITSSFSVNAKQVICIENLEQGTNAAAQVILKYLEEPLPYVYVVVTSCNPAKLPSTILSRSIEVPINPPKVMALDAYGAAQNSSKWQIICKTQLHRVARSLTDVDTFLNMPIDEIKYFEDSIGAPNFWSDSISNIIWNLQNYPSNKSTDVKLVIRYLYNTESNLKFRKCCLSALNDLDSKYLSVNAIVSKFVFDVRSI